MPYLIVLNEEALPEPYSTPEEARAEGERLAREYEDEHGRPAEWFIVPEETAH